MSVFDPKAIQDQVRDCLLADPFFASIPVISADPGDIATGIAAALEKLGLGVLVLVPSLTVTEPNQPGPYFSKIRLTVEVVENPTLSRASGNPTATTAVMVAAGLLHRFATNGISELIYVSDIVPVPDPEQVYNIWHMELTASGGVKYTQPAIASVIASPAGPGPKTVTLSCATVGAAIFYTLDGTYPAPRGSTSQIYTAPILVAAGQQLRARAWLAGYAPTNPPELTLNY